MLITRTTRLHLSLCVLMLVVFSRSAVADPGGRTADKVASRRTPVEVDEGQKRQKPEKTIHLVPMRDGATLATDVFLPTEGKGPWPVMFLRGPYGKNGYGKLLAGAVCAKGMVFVVQDMRGRFESPGSDAVIFLNDGTGKRRDGHDSLEWIAEQPWCNGNIGTWGGSALGITQTILAPGAPDALKAQYIRWGTSDFYAQAVHQGGVFRKSLVGGWLENIKADPETLKEYLTHYRYSDFWDAVNPGRKAEQVNAAGVYWGGWYDIFSQGTIDSFVRNHNHGGPRARGHCRLIVGPWAHGPLVEVEYPPNAKTPPATPGSSTKTLASADAMQFFAHHLMGVDNDVPRDKPVHYYVMGDVDDPTAPGNYWRAADNWPPSANRTDFYFHPDGRLLRDQPPTGESRVSYQYDPRDPVPTIGGQNMIIDRGPMDQRRVESRDDVLVFTSDVLWKPVEVTGRIAAKLYVSSDCPDTDFTVKLTDVYPDGRSMIVTDGILRARFRNSFEREDFLEAGKVYELNVDLWSTSLIFNSGHRIRVAVSSSNDPRFDPNPNTGKPTRADDEVRVATNTLYVSAAHPSHIILPIYAGADVIRRDAGPPVTIRSPREYQVFQRHNRTEGRIVVSGRTRVDADQVQVRFRGKPLDGDFPEDWQTVTFVPASQEFNQVLSFPAGGWYAMDIRVLKAGQPVAEAAVDKFGVGEVFVGAGQSNSTNSGQFQTRQASGMVSSFSGSHWQLADDPQPGVADHSQGGSFWPAFGDAMYAKYKVPIGVASTGFGGTSVNQWQPQTGLFRWMMTRVHQLGPMGFRALLWHQGESDVQMTSDEYYSKLQNVIATTRQQAGWEIPWFVAQVSYRNPQQPSFESTRTAQAQLWADKVALEGPDTDTLTGTNRDFDGTGIHFSPQGLKAHGKMWAEKVSPFVDRMLGE